MTRRAATSFLLLLASALSICGCSSDPRTGYAQMSPYSASYRTVAIPIFQNDTFERDVEFELTDALVKEVESRTPYKVSRSSRADTILTGRITRIERDQLSKSRRTGLSDEIVLRIAVDWEWKDARTGKVIQARKGYEGHGLFLPSTPSGEPIEYGQFAAVAQLARDVVDQMRESW